ncbi:MAG: hypothetical protein WC901_05705 [Candidatus Margulisiibacteriota bacterium]
MAMSLKVKDGVNRPNSVIRFAAAYLLPPWLVRQSTGRNVVSFYLLELALKPEIHDRPDIIIQRKIAAARALGHFSSAVAKRFLPDTIRDETYFMVVAAAAKGLRKRIRNTAEAPYAREELAAYVLLAPLIDPQRQLSPGRQIKQFRKMKTLGALAFPALRAALRCKDVDGERRVNVIAALLMESGIIKVVDDLVAIWHGLQDEEELREEFSRKLDFTGGLIKSKVEASIVPAS